MCGVGFIDEKFDQIRHITISPRCKEYMRGSNRLLLFTAYTLRASVVSCLLAFTIAGDEGWPYSRALANSA